MFLAGGLCLGVASHVVQSDLFSLFFLNKRITKKKTLPFFLRNMSGGLYIYIYMLGVGSHVLEGMVYSLPKPQ